MARMGLLALAAAGVFLVSGAAQAKAPPSGMDVCGNSACIHLDSQDAERFWTGFADSRRPTAAAPYYVLRWHFDAEPEQSAYYVPATGAMIWPRSTSRWGALLPDAVAALKPPLSGLEPYAAPTLTRVTVGRRVARDPGSYLSLFEGKPTWIFPATDWYRVTLRSAEPSPWTNGAALIRLGKTAPYVVIDGWTFKIPRTLAQRARRGLSLDG
jgi:hypothetical protein